MGNIKGQHQFPEQVYLWEETDPVQGGDEGIDNVPIKQLANRTQYLGDLSLKLFKDVFNKDPLGSFGIGFTLSSADQAVYDEESETWYEWLGNIPKVVSPGRTPANSGGIYNEDTNPTGLWRSIKPPYYDELDSLSESIGNLSLKSIKAGEATLDDTVEHSLFEFMSSSDIESIKSSPGVEINVDYALKKAVDSGIMSVRVPWGVGVYTSGIDLATLPLGFVLWANSARRPYTISGASSFTGTGVTWRTAVGAVAPFISTGRHVFRGINFDGRDGTTQLLYSTSSSTQFNGTRFEGCGIYRFAIGLGWSYYTGTLFAFRCSISGNGDGVRNLIDSSVVDCVINANGRGIALLTGANNNNFADNRIEWNNTYNIYVYNAIQNVVTGDLIDRSGSSGIVVSGTGSLTIGNLVLRRSGATATLGDNYSSHVHLIDNGEIIISGIKTGSGANDDGTGTVSPSFGITYSGAGTPKVTITGSDMSGFVTQAENVKVTPSAVIVGNRGINNRVTDGSSKVQFLRDCIDMKQSTLQATVGATAVYTLAIPTDDYSGPIQYGAVLERKLKVECRLSTAAYDIIDIPLIFRYEGSRAVNTWTAKVVATSARIGLDSSATGVIVTYSLSADGTALTVTLTSVDGIERKTRVTLLPQ